jgi:hypothetical protein
MDQFSRSLRSEDLNVGEASMRFYSCNVLTRETIPSGLPTGQINRKIVPAWVSRS